MRVVPSVIAAVVVCLCSGPSGGGARAAEPAQVSPSPERPQVHRQAASLGYRQYSAGVSWRMLAVDLQHRRYDWQYEPHVWPQVGQGPWHTLTRFRIRARREQALTGRWDARLDYAAMAGFERASSATWSQDVRLSAVRVSSGRVSLCGGAGLLYHPTDRVWYPAVALAWAPRENRRLSGVAGFPEAWLRWVVGKGAALRLELNWDVRFYGLADRNALAPSGTVRLEEWMPTFRFEYEAAGGLTLTAGVRQHLRRRLTLYDHTESELAYAHIGEAWAYLMSADYTF